MLERLIQPSRRKPQVSSLLKRPSQNSSISFYKGAGPAFYASLQNIVIAPNGAPLLFSPTNSNFLHVQLSCAVSAKWDEMGESINMVSHPAGGLDAVKGLQRNL